MVRGNPGKRKFNPDDIAAGVGGSNNGLVPPPRLGKRQLELWNEYIVTAPWLTKHDAPRARMWVELQAEFERSPRRMVAARISQLRSLGSELAFDPSSRARLAVSSPQAGPVDPARKYIE